MASSSGLQEKDFPKGTRIRLRLSGAVQKTNRDYSSLQMEGCLPVRETGTDMAWTQFIYLSSKQVVISGRNEGDTVTAEFDARVVSDYGTGDINTTRVREISRTPMDFEYQHFLFLPSTTITIVKECAVCGGPLSPGYGRHENGSDDTHVPVDPDAAAVADQFGGQYSFGAPSPVFSSEVIGNSTTVDEAIAAGLDLDAERARITRDFGLTAANSITVDPDGEGYSFDSAPDRKEPAVAFKRGDKIRVRLSGIVGVKPEPGMEATTAVAETDSNDGRRWTHYLYLNSSFIRGGSGGGFAPKSEGDTVTAEFDAQVIGEIGASLGGTTRVKEMVGEGFGYIHYVNLDSSSMSREIPLDELAEPNVTITAVPLAEALKPYLLKPYLVLKTGVSGASITANDKEILSAKVIDRISELEDALAKAPRYVLFRSIVREGQDRELGRFASAVAAEEFINFNDYNRSRVDIDVADAELNEEDEAELENLQRLSGAGRAMFGGVQWANGVVLYCNGFFDSDWARDLAADELNQDLEDLDSWPFDLIDWEQAADERKDGDYLRVDFDGEPYFGVNQ